MSKIDRIIARLHNIKDFQSINDVLEIVERTEFAINGNYEGEAYIIVSYTENTHTIKITDTEETTHTFEPHKYFWVKNAKRIAFVPLDGKRGIIKSGNKRCDVLLFDEFCICFVEFKTEAISLAERAIRKNRKESIEQLAETIKLFNEKLDNDYEDLEREAYICTPPTYPRNNADWIQKSVAFLETYGIRLYESNEKVCKQPPLSQVSEANL